MSNMPSTTTRKTFDVAYYLEQGFTVRVDAISAEDAEDIIRQRLADASGELAGSTRVHYDDGIVGAEEVAP